mmetsp:Transcript_15962/g.22739  ORF Transcript_15962/g.22739 Transcript_15962/m.22739 type:complete len:326 (+) Transcript_15962:154-1131(+)
MRISPNMNNIYSYTRTKMRIMMVFIYIMILLPDVCYSMTTDNQADIDESNIIRMKHQLSRKTDDLDGIEISKWINGEENGLEHKLKFESMSETDKKLHLRRRIASIMEEEVTKKTRDFLQTTNSSDKEKLKRHRWQTQARRIKSTHVPRKYSNESTLSPSSKSPKSTSKSPKMSKSPKNSKSPKLSSKTTSLPPSMSPSLPPSMSPSLLPSVPPSSLPTKSPTSSPSSHPSLSPTSLPSEYPSMSPTKIPSQTPSYYPSILPTESFNISDCPSYFLQWLREFVGSGETACPSASRLRDRGIIICGTSSCPTFCNICDVCLDIVCN